MLLLGVLQLRREVLCTIVNNCNFIQSTIVAIEPISQYCEAEIVHCDLKPSNIFLDNDLVAHVGDFGLVRLLLKPFNRSSEQEGSSTIAIKGTIEYGMGLAASTLGDVYSYRIILLEMITRRRPTDDIFILDLHNYVNRVLPEQVCEIVDPLILSQEEDGNRRMTPGRENINGGREMECIISLLKLGLKCSQRLPNDRMHMNEVVSKLHLIKDVFRGVRVHQEILNIKLHDNHMHRHLHNQSVRTNLFFIIFIPILLEVSQIVAMNFSVSHVSTAKQFHNETDRLALLEFKHQMQDDPFGVLKSWNHSQHHCQWEGVTCSTRHQRVIALRRGRLQWGGGRRRERKERGIYIYIYIYNKGEVGWRERKKKSFYRRKVFLFLKKFLHTSKSFSTNFTANCSKVLGKLPKNSLTKWGLLSHISASKQFQNETDRLALLEFKKQIYNDPLGVLNSWNHSQHHCQWEGITCGTRHQRVIALTLRHKHFSGIISPLVGNLSFMRFIHLEENQFHGEIPQEFGRLFRLRFRNKFKGQIPTNLEDLTNLQLLNLGSNLFGSQSTEDLDFIASLTNCSNLSVLSLSVNKFGGNMPKAMANLSNQLTEFYGGNILDNVLMNCQNLQYLDISQNNFTGIISPHFLETHSSLIYVGLSENSFTGSLPPEVGKLIHLADFNVSHNQLVGDIPMSLADCSNLENLFMQANFFQGTIPPNLASLKSIQQLDLSSNNLTVPIPIFSNASQISLIGNNKLCGGIPELEFPPCPVIKGKNRGKLKVIILLSIVLPATLLVLGALLLYFLVYQKRERRMVAGFSSMPPRIDELLWLSYHELLRATSGFSPENLIGSGNFGAVYKGRLEKHGNKLVAVKVLDLQKNGASKRFKAECKALRNIHHRNLLSIVSYCSTIDSKGDEFKAQVYEFLENGNLDLWLHPAETTDQATWTSSALHYLHDHCEAEIVHCDLKPSNICKSQRQPRGGDELG
ncbi:unnamed protein product [Coffea canephora]|uniref:non-specific serine/threonine protein kinase n=1 Tax=Coffea canephora TaxID=49390 RepID=A0A068V6Y1_COFCA|nr:unnamed protein product [Coffea canephora]